MMRKLALIALLLITCIGGAAFAQEATPQFCGTLSDADCAILNQSQQAMASLDSASFDLVLNATFSNLPDTPNDVSLAITGSGAYGGLNKVREDALALKNGESSDIGQALSTLLSDLDADISITINLPPEMTAGARGSVPNNITVQERLVDGIGYLNMDTLADLMPNARGVHGWYGLDLANFIKAMVQQMPNVFNNSMGNMNSMQAYQQAFADPEFINRFIKLSRTDDGSTSTATFEIKLNLGALMGSPEFQDMMRQQMQRQNPSMSDTEMNQAMAMSSQMFKGMDVTITEDIDTDDGYLHSVKGNFTFDATGMMATMAQTGASGSSTTTNGPAPQIAVDFTYTYSNFNNAPTISAPANPTIIPYQSLLRGMSASA